MLTRGEFASALTGVRAILSFKADAFRHFDASASGFWKSYWAAFLTLPIWALLESQQITTAAPASPTRYYALQGIAYVISWLAYPLLMVRVSTFLDRWPRYFTYMVAYNWFQLVQTVAWAPLLTLLAAGAPQELVVLVWMVTHLALFAYTWFIARRGLGVEAGAATALVIIDFLLGLLIDGVTQALG
jgi:hypothetical protein